MAGKIRLKHAVSLTLLAFVLISSFFVFNVSAEDTPTPPTVKNCRAACLYDKTHGKTIVMENPDLKLNTSTSAKVMMGLLACELLSDRLDETVTLTDAMLSGAIGNSMGLKAGERITVRDLLYGAICGSYNDAAYAVASICSGSAQGFTDMMNSRASSLGAVSTHYINPIGYPDDSTMLTTLSDTLKISLSASDNELYMEICSVKRYEISETNLSSTRTIHNRNDLLTTYMTKEYYNPSCRGMNAGETDSWSIITLACDEGAEYICIILGGEASEDGGHPYSTANELINWACGTYDLRKVFDKGQTLGKAEVHLTALGSQMVDYVTSDELSVYIPDSSNPELSYKISYIQERLEAPLKAGDVIGYATVYCNGERVGKCDIVLTESCDGNAVISAINAIGEYTKSRAFIATLICFALLLPTVLFFQRRRSRTRYKRKR